LTPDILFNATAAKKKRKKRRKAKTDAGRPVSDLTGNDQRLSDRGRKEEGGAPARRLHDLEGRFVAATLLRGRRKKKNHNLRTLSLSPI